MVLQLHHIREMHFHKAYRLLLFVCMSGLVACSGGDKPSLSYYDQANQHIENRNFESAIALMNDQIRKNPYDRKARVILASAYAARAGIYIDSYVDLVQSLIDSEKNSGHTTKALEQLQSQAHTKEERDLIDVLIDFNQALLRVTDFLIKFEKIPTIQSENQYEDLQRALDALSEPYAPEAGPSLYRGLLHIVVFRYHLQEYYRFPEVKSCHTDLSELYEKFTHFRTEVTQILADFVRGSQKLDRSQKLEAIASSLDDNLEKVAHKLSKYSESGETDISLFLLPFGVECE